MRLVHHGNRIKSSSMDLLRVTYLFSLGITTGITGARQRVRVHAMVGQLLYGRSIPKNDNACFSVSYAGFILAIV